MVHDFIKSPTMWNTKHYWAQIDSKHGWCIELYTSSVAAIETETENSAQKAFWIYLENSEPYKKNIYMWGVHVKVL